MRRLLSLISFCFFLSAPLFAQNSQNSLASQITPCSALQPFLECGNLFTPSRSRRAPAFLTSQSPANSKNSSSSQLVAKSPSVSPSPTTFGQKLDLDGIDNAGKIADTLYRGAQPHAEGFSSLKALGITTIVDLRQENPRRVQWERQQAEALGIRFIHIPVSGWDAPTDEQLSRFLTLFREDPQPKIFVHCRFGEDRTGVFVAAYRISQQNWSAERAIREMYLFGFNARWHPVMKSYVHSFPDHLAASPSLSPFRASPSQP